MLVFVPSHTMSLVLKTLVLALTVVSLRAQFNEFSSGSFECPFVTTCPVVCVNATDDCPTIPCPAGLTLCVDGSCQSECPDGLENPCPNCVPKVCPQEEGEYDQCLQNYSSYYEFESQCREQENSAAPTFSAVPVSFFTVWLIAVTVCTFFWTGVINSSRAADSKSLDEASGIILTGYQSNVLGNIVFISVVITLCGFHVLLLMYTIASYKLNQEESLRMFEIVWGVGFLWTLIFKWPYSIGSIAYKRCKLNIADTVCVFSPSAIPESLRSIKQQAMFEKNHVDSRKEPQYLGLLQYIGNLALSVINGIMARLFGVSTGGSGTTKYLPIKTDKMTGTRYFVFQFRRYNYNSETETFENGCLKVVQNIGDVLDADEGLSSTEVERRLRIVGPNVIEMQKPWLLGCILSEFAKPFYVYQLFMLWTWIPLSYFYMGIIHGTCVVVGGLTAAFFHFRNETNLFKLSHIDGEINCKRNGKLITVQQNELVPGDVVVVSHGLVYSDMILLATEGLLVDESALTGESTPMAKTAVDPSQRKLDYSPVVHKKHTISAGTTVIESEIDHNLAVVLATGSFTSKGELLREIFQYQRARFEFDAEVPFVLAILLMESALGFVAVNHLIIEQPVYAWFYGMYVVSCLLPPLLPTVFTVSVGISENRLSQKRIACSKSEDILVAGKVTRAFFDKTGTLTRQGLDFISAKCRESWDSEEAELSADLVMGMSCCHHLTQSMKGELIGNPVDKTMFAASRAHLVSAGAVDRIVDGNGKFVDILKHFDFDHHRMTQSVVAKRADGMFVCYVKGSGESIQKLCDPSTLPVNYESAVKESAKSGTYQISMAMKVIPDVSNLSSLSRDDAESNLTFVGVINFKNVLREETAGVISHLESGEVQCVMVTGDSVLTGIRIAKECGMIKSGVTVLLCSSVNENGYLSWIDENTEEAADLPSRDQLGLGSQIELAVTGDVWEHLVRNDPSEAATLAPAIRVYGRCTPFTKVSVVSTFVEHGFITLMAGDGGNDCGALKTAHVGVALSDAEASIVSPFTSLDKTITSVVEILKEGRCALASALASYKYVIMYGQIEGLNNVILAYFHINFAEYNWAFMDGFWVIGMSFTLPLAKAALSLSASRPTSSLLGTLTTSSVLGILCINVLFTCTSLYILFHQDWFQCRKYNNKDVSNLLVIGDNYESETLFIVSGYQYISTAMAYNFGYEFRRGWFQNTWFVCLVIVYTLVHYWITLFPGNLSCLFRVNCENEDVIYSIASGKHVPIQNAFNTTLMPIPYRFILVFLITLNTILNMSWDYFVVNGTRRRLLAKRHKQEFQKMINSPAGDLELT